MNQFFEEIDMCNKHRRGGPMKLGAIIVSPVTICGACEKFEECLEPPALIARIALELAARKAVELDNRSRRARTAFDSMN